MFTKERSEKEQKLIEMDREFLILNPESEKIRELNGLIIDAQKHCEDLTKENNKLNSEKQSSSKISKEQNKQ